MIYQCKCPTRNVFYLKWTSRSSINRKRSEEITHITHIVGNVNVRLFIHGLECKILHGYVERKAGVQWNCPNDAISVILRGGGGPNVTRMATEKPPNVKGVKAAQETAQQQLTNDPQGGL
ncbi:hypothetical protein Tsp_05584 [Trichinella spiralis]|uniref:hypothetical protein n=1 Tax=Trichinella spiralis TaxID=6334 RepID=UPI0001EFDF96|nr:hypothetical protein Tsp_05584 [Trichinella spiralis]